MKIEWQWDVQDAGFEDGMARAADAALTVEGIAYPCGVFIRVTDDVGIREMNRAHRGIDSATDVLSFPEISYKKGQTLKDAPKKLRAAYDADAGCAMLGAIVISLERAISQAKEYGHTAKRETAYMVVHAMCHLMGYDHMTDEDKERMRLTEETALFAIGEGRDDGQDI